MDIKTFKLVAPSLPADIAILARGPTGVGKSHLAKAISIELGLPFIDVRGSTMSEGDVGGYPDIEGMKESGVMTFCMPSWFMRACKEPVVLMLDELNRSLPGVQQSFFQLVLDRELGNDKNGVPYRLHPDTRVIAAVNHGAEYDVNDMDPALLRRFWVCDLEPTSEDWISWAVENDIDSVVIDFIRENPGHLRVDPSKVEPGTIVPTPASWHRLSDSLVHMGFAPSKVAGTKPPIIYPTAMGFVGIEAGIAFTDFVQNYAKVISAEDILDGKVTDGSTLNASEVAGLLDKLAEHCKANKWSVTEAKNVAKFGKSLTGEMMVQLWNKCSATQNLANIQSLHKLIGQAVVKIVQASRAVK
jgi:hypothetical protein